jgi:DNA-binding transcriptional regulator YiaG
MTSEGPHHHAHRTRRVRRDWHYKESGLSNVRLTNCVVLLCSNCSASTPVLPDIHTIKFPIAEALIRQSGRLTGAAVRFLRKSMGMTADEFAALLSTTRVEVSRWENDRVQISGRLELQLRLEVIEKLLPPSERTSTLREEVLLRMTRQYSAGATLEEIAIDAAPFYTPAGKSAAVTS